jgi:hypothetical protein
MTTRDMAGPNAFLEALGDNRRLLFGRSNFAAAARR